MERLTYWNEEYGCWSCRCPSGDAAKRLTAYEDTGLEPEEIKKAFNEEAVLKLAAQALGTTPERLREMAKAGSEGPCGLCRYNPPSSCDGKPCTMCPAEAAIGGGGDG